MSNAKIDAALAHWTLLYEHLRAAQGRLDALRFDSDADRRALILEVARLLRESESALKAIQLQLDRQSVPHQAGVPAPAALAADLRASAESPQEGEPASSEAKALGSPTQPEAKR